MRGTLIGLVVFGLAGTLRAGVYDFDSERSARDIPPEQLRPAVSQVRLAGLAKESEYRSQVQERARNLELRRKEDLLSTRDLLKLSACYLRLNRPQDALRVLEDG